MKNKLAALLSLVLLTPWIYTACTSPETQPTEDVIPEGDARFVGMETCSSCHAAETKDWESSHHAHSMEPPQRESILAPFDGEEYAANKVSYRFYVEGEKFWVEITEKDQPAQSFEIAYTFGYTPLQQYLVELPNGKLQTLRVSWDTEEKKWFHQYKGDIIPVHDWLHWSQQSMNWNSMCADCHSTDVRKNYNPFTQEYQTQFAEVNVSCESCHGPGSLHAESAGADKGKTLANEAPENYINTCGACHSRRSKLLDGHDHDADFYDQYHLTSLDPAHYQLDGQIEDEDFVLTSFLSSKMSHRDVNCADCHNPHTNALKLEGNNLCLQCHQPQYAKKEHHFHPEESNGAQCINCHMPGKTYMGNDYRRDHSFRVPRPDQSLVYGTTNACTQCHTDQSDAWAAKFIAEQYGPDRPHHFSDSLLAGRVNGSMSALISVVKDTAFADLARASALESLGSFPAEAWWPQISSIAPRHPSPQIRAAVQMALFSQVSDQWITVISNGLKDKATNVQLMAYRNALRLPPEIRPSGDMVALQSTYEKYLEFNADFKEGRNHWAEYAQINGDRAQAILRFTESLAIDSVQPEPYVNLAILYSQEYQNDKAEEILSTLHEQFPQDDYGYYLHGLLLLETGDNDRAIAYLEKAIDINPFNDNYWRNLVNAYEATGNQKGIDRLRAKYEKIFGS
ncbi:MAG: tetratricopeptide repeat protein [Schleiferiaceae bacterium]